MVSLCFVVFYKNVSALFIISTKISYTIQTEI